MVFFFQAETEELGRKVDSLTTENVALKSDLTRLTENSEKLRQENAKLMVRPIFFTLTSHHSLLYFTRVPC